MLPIGVVLRFRVRGRPQSCATPEAATSTEFARFTAERACPSNQACTEICSSAGVVKNQFRQPMPSLSTSPSTLAPRLRLSLQDCLGFCFAQPSDFLKVNHWALAEEFYSVMRASSVRPTTVTLNSVPH